MCTLVRTEYNMLTYAAGCFLTDSCTKTWAKIKSLHRTAGLWSYFNWNLSTFPEFIAVNKTVLLKPKV